ncbi:WXG100 family type VII secretion target [Streptomyces sp. BE308]|uniref:WXG100 family type VII secretion target n=1 Tax=Streptomyces sp. BE308 TaxID=3002529 RepID=UPI002E78CA25|nr:WXG100 family type VII secretion target [Streptomyces sp. BE308]MEE1794880.1 WXG100 family type VII secretion target [Streptomyces sp. BE308]
MENADLAVTDGDLTRLADELGTMQRHLDQQVRRMDAVVDQAEAQWQSPAASAYRKLHRKAGEDAVRIRDILALLEEAVRMSRDGFSQQELDVLQSMLRVQRSTDAAAEVRALSGESGAGATGLAAAPRSRIDDI